MSRASTRFIRDEVCQAGAFIGCERLVLAGDTRKHHTVGARANHITRNRDKAWFVGRAIDAKRRGKHRKNAG